jgi:DNA polymerase III epsilon subunit-like protein
MYLFFDTETTGKLDEGPHVVQVAALLADIDHKTVGEVNVLIKPDGWIVPDHVAKIHGITTERAEAYGVPISIALNLYDALARRAETLVAHNIDFDCAVLGMEYERLHRHGPGDGKEIFCTMRESTDLVRLPSPYGKPGFKWPRLTEAYSFFFNEEFVGAHDARNDLLACQRIFMHLQKQSNNQTTKGAKQCQ